MFRAIAELDESVAEQLEKIETPHDAKVIVCNILRYNADQINWCSK